MQISRGRIISYIAGLFIMTLGIAVSIKADLGVSPVSSLPYTLTLTVGIEMGKATILWQSLMVLAQLLILRKDFKKRYWLQILVGIVFGYFTTFANGLMALLPSPGNLLLRAALLAASVLLIALGLAIYVRADIMNIANEGVMQAVSFKTGVAFSRVKMAFDISMAVLSAVICLLVTGGLGSIGVGTVAAAVLVGPCVGLFNRALFVREEEAQPPVAAE